MSWVFSGRAKLNIRISQRSLRGIGGFIDILERLTQVGYAFCHLHTGAIFSVHSARGHSAPGPYVDYEIWC